jgi:hypothetical protein
MGFAGWLCDFGLRKAFYYTYAIRYFRRYLGIQARLGRRLGAGKKLQAQPEAAYQC